MISLEQIRLLEAKITKAAELIRTLKAENKSLRKTLDSAQSRMQDLETLVGDLKRDQKEIEAGILRAIKNLDQLEDEVSEPSEAAGGRPDAESEGGVVDAAEGDAVAASETSDASGASDAQPAHSETDATDGDEDGAERELDIF